MKPIKVTTAFIAKLIAEPAGTFTICRNVSGELILSRHDFIVQRMVDSESRILLSDSQVKILRQLAEAKRIDWTEDECMRHDSFAYGRTDFDTYSHEQLMRDFAEHATWEAIATCAENEDVPSTVIAVAIIEVLELIKTTKGSLANAGCIPLGASTSFGLLGYGILKQRIDRLFI